MSSPAMDIRAALTVLRELRTANDVVVTSMGSAREWMAMGPLDPLDFVFVPSSMGEAPSLGMGLALAQPGRRVFACNGDGSTLMNLGALATISAAAPDNLVLIVFDNGVYEVTGAQPTPGSALGRPDRCGVDFAQIARACGWPSVFRYSELDEWRRAARDAINSPGPVFIALDVAPVPGAIGPKSPGPTVERARKFIEALCQTNR
jgi:thiamine pyrophosphate-dependent acetolactate synthase large subunit-like protein